MPGARVLGVAASNRQQEPAEREASRDEPPARSHLAQTPDGAGRCIAQCLPLAARGAAFAPISIASIRMETYLLVTLFSLPRMPLETPVD